MKTFQEHYEDNLKVSRLDTLCAEAQRRYAESNEVTFVKEPTPLRDAYNNLLQQFESAKRALSEEHESESAFVMRGGKLEFPAWW